MCMTRNLAVNLLQTGLHERIEESHNKVFALRASARACLSVG